MLVNKGSSLDYLIKYKEGKIKHGLDTGTQLDDYLRFKRSQLNIILGHDNVGKTYWFQWYMLVLALRHGIKFAIWSGENSTGQILRDMVQMYKGKQFKDLSISEIQSASGYLEQFFTFVDNRKLYKPDELLKIFSNLLRFTPNPLTTVIALSFICSRSGFKLLCNKGSPPSTTTFSKPFAIFISSNNNLKNFVSVLRDFCFILFHSVVKLSLSNMNPFNLYEPFLSTSLCHEELHSGLQ